MTAKPYALWTSCFLGIGEIVGGSQREERLDKLEQRMDEMGIPKEETLVSTCGYPPLCAALVRTPGLAWALSVWCCLLPAWVISGM